MSVSFLVMWSVLLLMHSKGDKKIQLSLTAPCWKAILPEMEWRILDWVSDLHDLARGWCGEQPLGQRTLGSSCGSRSRPESNKLSASHVKPAEVFPVVSTLRRKSPAAANEHCNRPA